MYISPLNKFTPFELIFGNSARSPSSYPTEGLETYTSYIQELIKRLNDPRYLATESLIEYKHRSKYHYDRTAREHPYSIGDHVYVLCEIVEILDTQNFVIENESGKRILKHMHKIIPANHQ